MIGLGTQASSTPRKFELEEWDKKEYAIQPQEFLSIASIPNNAVSCRLVGDGKVLLTTNSVVGRFRTADIDLIIRPKLTIESLLFLFGEVYGIEDLHNQFAGYKSNDEIDDLLVQIFISSVEKLVRQGIKKEYESRREELAIVRGRIDIRKTTNAYYRGNTSVHCEFDEYSNDCAENQILVAALEQVIRRQVSSTNQRQAAWKLQREFGEITSLHPKEALSKKIFKDRLNQNYFPAISLSRIILNIMGILHDYGSVDMYGFQVDMNRLFELYIAQRLKKEMGPNGTTVESQNSYRFDHAGQAHIRPDLIIQSSRGRRIVADTKYKVTNKPKREDLYQILSYCQILGVRKGILITVGDFSENSYMVADNETVIKVIPVKMSGSPDDLRLTTQRLADTFQNELC